jgi:enamine deaminase RidA (YjgF/YER057c/UK114 family)
MPKRNLRRHVYAALVSVLLFVQPALAQNASEEVPDICNNQLVVAMDNLITLLAVIGPVVGAVVAMGSMLVLTTTQNPQKKKKWMKTRNDAIKYGIGILFVGAIMQLLVTVVAPEGMSTCIDAVGI